MQERKGNKVPKNESFSSGEKVDELQSIERGMNEKARAKLIEKESEGTKKGRRKSLSEELKLNSNPCTQSNHGSQRGDREGTGRGQREPTQTPTAAAEDDDKSQKQMQSRDNWQRGHIHTEKGWGGCSQTIPKHAEKLRGKRGEG